MFTTYRNLWCVTLRVRIRTAWSILISQNTDKFLVTWPFVSTTSSFLWWRTTFSPWSVRQQQPKQTEMWLVKYTSKACTWRQRMEQTCFSCWFIRTRTCRCVCAHINPTEWYIPARFGETFSSRRFLVWGNDLKPNDFYKTKGFLEFVCSRSLCQYLIFLVLFHF